MSRGDGIANFGVLNPSIQLGEAYGEGFGWTGGTF